MIPFGDNISATSLTFDQDGKGVTFYDGAVVYKKSGTGLVTRLHAANTRMQVENNSGTILGTYWDSGNLPITSFAKTFLDDANGPTVCATIGAAPLASPALTGTPTAPTAAAGTNTTQLATTAYVRNAVADLVGAVPSTLDTLDELAQALGDDPNFATTVTTAIGTKAPSSDVNVGTAQEGSGDPFSSRSSYNGRGGLRTGTGGGPFGSAWYNIVDVRHRNSWSTGDVYGGELAWGMTANWWRAAFRSRNAAGTPTPWVEFWTDANRPVVNCSSGGGTTGKWFKILTLVLGTQYESTHAVVDYTLDRNSPDPAHFASGTIYIGIKQQNPISSPLDIITVSLKNQIGIISHSQIMAIKTSDNAATKNVELWIQNPSDYGALRAVISDMYGTVAAASSGGAGVVTGSLPSGPLTAATPLSFDPAQAMRRDAVNNMAVGSEINFGGSYWKHFAGGGGIGYATSTDRIMPAGASANKPGIELSYDDDIYPSTADYTSSVRIGWLDATSFKGFKFYGNHNGANPTFDILGVDRQTYGSKQTFTADGTIASGTTLVEIDSSTDRTINLYTPVGGEIIEVVGLSFGASGHRLYPPSGSTINFSKAGGTDITCGPSGSPTTVFRVRTGSYRLIGGSNGNWYYTASNN